MKKKETTRVNELNEEMKVLMINTFEGKKSLLQLCQQGIKQKICYYNMIEKPVPKRDRTVNNLTMIKKVIHDYGFVFDNEFEIRHVDKKYWNLFPGEITEVRERV